MFKNNPFALSLSKGRPFMVRWFGKLTITTNGTNVVVFPDRLTVYSFSVDRAFLPLSPFDLQLVSSVGMCVFMLNSDSCLLALVSCFS